MSSIQLKIENKVATITLNRPEVFNSFNREMAFLLHDTLDACKKNDAVRAIVLTGNGKAFCAGQDLKEVTDPELNPGFKKILEEHYNPIITRIRSIKKPIIGAINVHNGKLTFSEKVELIGDKSFRKGLDQPFVFGNRLYVRDSVKTLHIYERVDYPVA